ncbi:MAG: MarC family protein [Gammaproteobacteria bacterium]|nr:MarC family protein [Gammaproteobacteria bacterium]
MLEIAIVALTTLFATVGPLDVAAVFAGLTAGMPKQRRQHMAIRAALIAGIILIIFALVGEMLLASLGISIAALRTAGGILLLLIGMDMVFARHSGGTSTTDEEEAEAKARQDISVFPLATPLMAGPGAMGATILLMANAEGNYALQAIVIGSIVIIIGLALLMCLLSTQLERLLGTTGMQVVGRIMGVLLSALAVQFIFDGIAQSGLLATS